MQLSITSCHFVDFKHDQDKINCLNWDLQRRLDPRETPPIGR